MCTYLAGIYACGCQAVADDGTEHMQLDPCGRGCAMADWIYGGEYQFDALMCAACHGRHLRRWVKLIGRFPRQLQTALKDDVRDRHRLLVRQGHYGTQFYANYESFIQNVVEIMATRAAEWVAMGRSKSDIRIANLPNCPNVPRPGPNGRIINTRGDPECPDGWRPQPGFTSAERDNNVVWTHKDLTI